MPAVSLTTLPSIPYVFSGNTGTANTCQIVTLPNRSGVVLVIHNRDQEQKPLRISFDATLTQDGEAPNIYFSIGDPLRIEMNSASFSGYPHSGTLALFSSQPNVNYELLFMPG